MDTFDFSHLSVADLDKLANKVKDLAKVKRDEDLKSLVTEFLKKANDLNVSEIDLINEIKSRKSVSVTKTPKKTNVIVKPKSWVYGATYCDPNGPGKPWIGGTNGPKPPWLLKLIPGSLTPEEATAEYSKLLKS